MTNEITINIDELLLLPDNSITDPETIRQIALYGIKNNSNLLNCKVKREFEFLGLYPTVYNAVNIIPDKLLDKMISELKNARKH